MSLTCKLPVQVSANTRATAAAVQERTKSAAAVAQQQVGLHHLVSVVSVRHLVQACTNPLHQQALTMQCGAAR